MNTILDMNTIRRWFAMALIVGVFDAGRVAAADELPLGSERNEIVAAYGRPDPHPVHYTLHPPGSPPPKKVDTIMYRSLKPPRFYWFTDDHATGVHYYNLTGYNLDFVKTLLSAHASGGKVEELQPKTTGGDQPGGAYSWKCTTKGWTALYRPGNKDTASSLLITEEQKRKNAEPTSAGDVATRAAPEK